MTLDPSIILSGRPVQIQSPFEQAGQAMQLRELQMGLKAKAQAQADDEAIRKAFGSNLNPDGSLNRQGVLAALATSNPMARQKIEHTWAAEDSAKTKAQADAREAALKVDKAQGQLFADVGAAVLQAHNDGKPEEAQLAWTQGLQRAKAAGLNVDGVPTQYDPRMAAGYYQVGINALERWKQQEGFTGFHPTEGGGVVQVNGRGQARPVVDAQGAPVRPRAQTPAVNVNVGEQKEFTNETTLRKEYNDEIKGFKGVKDAFKRIEIAGKNNTAASDISLIYGYMKLMDPGSVVREGEFATAQNAGGIPDRIRAAYNNAISGERLAPDVKNDFLKQAQLIYEQALAQQQTVASRYRGIAERFRLNPDNVVTDEGRSPAGRPRLGEIVDGYRYEGGDPASPASWKKVK